MIFRSKACTSLKGRLRVMYNARNGALHLGFLTLFTRFNNALVGFLLGNERHSLRALQPYRVIQYKRGVSLQLAPSRVSNG